MARGKYLSLEEARKDGRLVGEEFWAEKVYRAMASLSPAARARAVSTFASSPQVPSS